MRPRTEFRRRDNGLLARDCISCEGVKRKTMHDGSNVRQSGNYLVATREFPGVDIDRIHHKLGKVRR